MKKIIVWSLLFGILSGCASTATHNEPKATPYEDYIAANNLESLDRVKAFRFRGWRSLDDKHLIISTSPKKPYLITLRSRCVELKYSQGISINHGGTSVLYAGTDSISVPKNPHNKCVIQKIHKLTDEQADEVSSLKKRLAAS